VERRQRRAVHLPGQQDFRLQCLVQGDRAAIAENLAAPRYLAEAGQGDVGRARADAGLRQDVAQSDARPFGVADGAQIPKDFVGNVGHLRQFPAAISGALQRGRDGLRWERVT